MTFDGDAFMKKFLDVWNAHDIDAITAMMTPDCVFEPSFVFGVLTEPGGLVYSGLQEVRRGLEKNFREIPDLSWDEIRHFVCPDHAVVEWITKGTPRGGKAFTVQGCDILMLRDGKIWAKRSYRKATV